MSLNSIDILSYSHLFLISHDTFITLLADHLFIRRCICYWNITVIKLVYNPYPIEAHSVEAKKCIYLKITMIKCTTAKLQNTS